MDVPTRNLRWNVGLFYSTRSQSLRMTPALDYGTAHYLLACFGFTVPNPTNRREILSCRMCLMMWLQGVSQCVTRGLHSGAANQNGRPDPVVYHKEDGGMVVQHGSCIVLLCLFASKTKQPRVEGLRRLFWPTDTKDHNAGRLLHIFLYRH